MATGISKTRPLGIKEALALPHSSSTIYRVLKENGLTGKRKRKHHKKKDLRAIKAALKPFEKIQVAVKYLDDIPQYFTYYQNIGFLNINSLPEMRKPERPLFLLPMRTPISTPPPLLLIF